MQIKLLKEEENTFWIIAQRLSISKAACVQAITQFLYRISESDRHKAASQVLNEAGPGISYKISARNSPNKTE